MSGPAGATDDETGAGGYRRVRVAVVGPLALRRAALSGAIADDRSLEVVAVGDELPQVAPAVAASAAEVVVVDAPTEVGVPAVEILRSCADIVTAAPAARVLLVVVDPELALTTAARRAGVACVVDARGGLVRLREAIHAVHDGVARVLPDRSQAADDEIVDVTSPSLTAREHEVLTLLSKGLDVAEIARRLYISPHTLKTHIRNLLRKLGAHGRVEAVRIAVERGLVGADDRPPTGGAPRHRRCAHASLTPRRRHRQ